MLYHMVIPYGGTIQFRHRFGQFCRNVLFTFYQTKLWVTYVKLIQLGFHPIMRHHHSRMLPIPQNGQKFVSPRIVFGKSLMYLDRIALASSGENPLAANMANFTMTVVSGL